MIYLYSGTPGSGKTLHAVDVIYRWRRGFVIGNLSLNVSGLKPSTVYMRVDNAHLTPRYLIEQAGVWFAGGRVREGQLLLVVDEAQLLFNARSWQSNSDWISFFTQHRKYGYDVILIAQFDRMIDRQIRSLIEYEYVHRKISNLGGIWGIVFSIILGRYHVYERWYAVRDISVGGHRVRYSKKIFNLYNTFETL